MYKVCMWQYTVLSNTESLVFFYKVKTYSVIKVRYKVAIYSVQYNIVKFSVDCMIASSLLRLQLKNL